jgi:hypothetical protein
MVQMDGMVGGGGCSRLQVAKTACRQKLLAGKHCLQSSLETTTHNTKKPQKRH